MKTNNFITVLTFNYPSEVAIIRSRLESEGIECFVQDELTVQVNPFISNAIGGIKLQVRESDLEQTIEILKETGYIKTEDGKQPEKFVHLSNLPMKNEENIKCPSCGSEEVSKTKKAGWLFLITSLLLFITPTPFLSKKYHCFDCGNEFKN